MTSDEHQRNPRSDAPLEGRAALDLYLTELTRNVASITEQSVLLLKALSDRVTLMREIETGQAPSRPSGTTAEQTPAGDDVTPPASPDPSTGRKP
jgi:hypothetical protein